LFLQFSHFSLFDSVSLRPAPTFLFGFGFQRRFNSELKMADSRDLLAQYAEKGSEEAFRTLVERYVNLVYCTAIRLVDGNSQLAEDVTQTVFIDLAQKAHGLSSGVMLGGWLHRRTLNVATTLMRGERRRSERERRAVEMRAVDDQADSHIPQIAPFLDEAINRLAEDDRAAVLLRFFEQQGFDRIGRELGSSEDAARMRVTRALEKLHGLLRGQGVTLSAGALGTALMSGVATGAPAGLAATVAGMALATTAGAGVGPTLFGVITMAKLKAGVVCAVLVAGVATPIALQHQTNTRLQAENQALRQQIVQLDATIAENERRFRARNATGPRLPAPSMQPEEGEASADRLRGTNLIAQVINSTNAMLLKRQQLEAYLEENRRSPGSLLAAFRATKDQTLLQEAIEKYPNDPQVAFMAAYRLDGGDRRQWLEVFKQSAPDNALASYLAAGEYFKSGNIDKAVQDLTAAAGKSQFVDYTMEFGQHDEEAWRAAGYSVAEAKTIGSTSLLLPHLAETKELTHQMVNLAKAYQQAGDDVSAQITLQMALGLGQRLDQSVGTPLITKLVGRAIEGISLRAMDPNLPYGVGGQTVQQRLQELAEQRARITEVGQQFDALTPRLTEQDWISYRDRWRTFGEEAALKWLIGKYGNQ
jgi:RNA polymerase sigma factor (sigma-70 family)